jgi:putative RecB family exonuclease
MIGSKRGQAPKPPDGTVKHLSYSSLSTGLECMKRFELGRIIRAPQTTAWWFAGGSAVHAAAEKYDRMEFVGQERAFQLGFVWERCFEAEIEKLKKVEPDEKKWRSGKERYNEWNESGPIQVQNYINWRQRSPYRIWTTPDGQPAVELDVGGRLPGCDLEIKAYIDRIFIDPNLGAMPVIDLKSGKTKPSSPLQFGVYAALVEVKYGVRPEWGAALMTRDGALHKPYPLAKYTPEYVGRQMGALERAIKAKAFTANVGGHCWNCDVSAACYAADGPLAGKWDPDHPDMKVPF